LFPDYYQILAPHLWSLSNILTYGLCI
jgi:hypothetical protein